MRNIIDTNNNLLNKIYKNLLEYVSVIEKEDSNNKADWINGFVAQCEKGDRDFSFIYKNLKEGLISQFGFEMANEVILPQIIWSDDLSEFCD